MMRARLPVVLLMSCAVALAGCTGDDAASSDEPRPAESASPGAGAPSPSPVPAASLTPLVPPRTIDDSQGHKITVSVVTLKRQGKLTLLEVAARNDHPSDRANIADSLRGAGSRFDGATLLDPVNGKRYLVARDSQDECLCTSFVGSVSVDAGGTAILGAYFAAPPDDVTAMNVVLPGAGTFTNVPVS